LFDVSHMCQLKLTGNSRVDFLETLVVGDIKGLKVNHATLSSFTNEKGGMIDDTVITNKGDHIYFVVNAGCADKDKAHLKAQLSKYKAANKTAQVELTELPEALVALQGPKAESVLKRMLTKPFELEKMPFMTSTNVEVDGVKCLVGRCGYTGEDGFEISIPVDKAMKIAKKILSFPEVKPAGLGARDSLRLEAGLCLYGHDINEEISPIEAGLAWTIGKRRREEGGFLGASLILKQLKEGVTRKRVGLFVEGPPAREGYTIHDKDEKQIGIVTSGTMSPILKKAISMGYVDNPHNQIGSQVQVKVRNKLYPAVITKMPFVPTSYKKL
jgi:aminomethyltransferase